MVKVGFCIIQFIIYICVGSKYRLGDNLSKVHCEVQTLGIKIEKPYILHITNKL